MDKYYLSRKTASTTNGVCSENMYIASEVDAYIAKHLPRWIPVVEPPEKNGWYIVISDSEVIERKYDRGIWHTFTEPTYWLDNVPQPPQENKDE